MSRRLPCLVATIALAAGLTAAEPTSAGSPFALGSGQFSTGGPQRLVYVHGLLDLDLFANGNTTDGQDNRSDSQRTTRFRSELGVRIELDERIETKLTVAYQAQAGDYSAADPENNVVMDDAYVVLKEFFGQPNLSIRAGRMPVAWNLRTDQGGFLYDSRADYPTVTSWDGARFQWGIETLVFTPFAYAMPDDSTLYGLVVDWQPEQATENGLFMTGTVTMHRDVVTYDRVPTGVTGDELLTWYGGVEFRLDTWDLYAEGGLQTGDADDSREYSGFAVLAGAQWHPRTAFPQSYTLQYDWLSGDDDPSDNKLRQWVNPFEGQQDTLLGEHEKYGEITRYADQGGFGRTAIKLIGDWGLDRNGIIRLKSAYAYYQLAEDRGLGSELGQEIDLQLTWQYNRAGNTFLSLFGAVFLPGDGFEAVAPSQPASDDMIYLFGANLQTAF